MGCRCHTKKIVEHGANWNAIKAMISDHVRSAVDEEYPEILTECFGLWSNSLWSRYNGLEKFSDLKDAFFYLVDRLLTEGAIRFVRPNEDVLFTAGKPPPKKRVSDVETHWLVPNEEILDYLRKRWPKDAVDFDDRDLSLFFFEIPPIVWRDADGKWIGS